MTSIDLRSFWDRFQSGLEIAVASSAAHKLLGTRDGFLQYFREGLHRSVSIALVPHGEHEVDGCLPLSDEEAIAAARQEALGLEQELGESYHFYVGNEGGLHTVELDGQVHYFVRCWTVIRCAVGEAWGGSGSVQIPDRLIAGLDNHQVPLVIPGRRRAGGMVESLTGGLESRRSSVASATVHALSTLFFGMLESRPGR
jgi:non-canonical (house-cleaning) NTP pyrophosphatase